MAKEVNTPTISLNLRPYCNLLFPYENTEDIDKTQLLEDVKFWGSVLSDIDTIMKEYDKTKEIPDDVEIITKCQKCGGSNLTFSSGTSKATGKKWYAFDCQDCVTERGGKEYPTRNFTKTRQTINTASEALNIPDDEDIPF